MLTAEWNQGKHAIRNISQCFASISQFFRIDILSRMCAVVSGKSVAGRPTLRARFSTKRHALGAKQHQGVGPPTPSKALDSRCNDVWCAWKRLSWKRVLVGSLVVDDFLIPKQHLADPPWFSPWPSLVVWRATRKPLATSGKGSKRKARGCSGQP